MEKREHSSIEFLLFFIFLILWLMLITNRRLKDNTLWHTFSSKNPLQLQLLCDQGQSFLTGFYANGFPVIGIENMSDTSSASKIYELFQSEIFPVPKYIKDYWSDYSGYELLYNGAVPKSFLESDEDAKLEKKHKHAKMSEPENGETYTKENLLHADYLLKHFYIVDETTALRPSDFSPAQLLAKNLSFPISKNKPTILIYHTHGSETYQDGGTVIEIGEQLKTLLEEKYGFSVIHDRNVYDQINGELNRSKAYDYAGSAVSEQLKQTPSIQMILDIHRDSVDSDTHLLTKIHGKRTAQIMFFNGVSYRKQVGEIHYLENPNKTYNLALSLQMQLLAAKYFSNFTRRIYIKGYRYNLHLRKRSMLIEVGAENNTSTEAKNAMAPLAELIYRLAEGEKAY